MKLRSMSISWGLMVGAVIIALLFTSLILVLAGAQPFRAYWDILVGSIGSITKISDVIRSWVPLALVTSGLLIAFTAGLWNIGIEGQIALGAIFTTGALRLLENSSMPAGLIIFIAILAGAAGGALWASLVGLLRIYGGVNEIFGGLGMNFIATALTIFLIFGPWKRPGVASMSGTELFDRSLWLPQVPGYSISLWSIGLALAGLALVFFLLRGTYFGLKLKAVGKNNKAAFVMGIPTSRYMLYAFLMCGVFAGLAGSIQVVGLYHRLIPSISSGYGFLGLLVAMLVNFQPLLSALVAFFFAALNIGAIQLPINLRLDSNLSGVLQGALVLFVLLMSGVRQKLMQNPKGDEK